MELFLGFLSLCVFCLFAGADRRFVFWQMTAAKTCCPITENLYFYSASCINWMQTALQWKIFNHRRNLKAPNDNETVFHLVAQ
jgi:hypothetical protein